MAHNSPYVTENSGDPFTVEPANPAAGAGLTVAVPAGQVWLLEQVGFTLATSIVIPTRRANIEIETLSAKLQYATLPLVVQSASLAYTYVFALFGQAAAVVGLDLVVQVPLGRWYIPPQSNIFIGVINLDIADQMSAITYSYRAWYLVG